MRFYSVTTILGEGIPKPALKWWAARESAEYAIANLELLAGMVEKGATDEAIELVRKAHTRTTRKAAARGTDVHRAAEALAYGETPELTEEVAPYVEQYRRFLEAHAPEFHAAEMAVYNYTYAYAGTLDAIVTIDGHTGPLDAKTTDKGPDASSRPPYPEVALQLSAYAHAEWCSADPAQMRSYGGRRYYIAPDEPEGALEPMPELSDVGWSLVISPVDYELVPTRIGDDVWKAFLHAREIARWQLHTSQSVFGPPVAGRKAA